MTTRRAFIRGVIAASAAAVLPAMRAEEWTGGTVAAAGAERPVLTIADIRRLRAELERVTGAREFYTLVVSPKNFKEFRRRRLLEEWPQWVRVVSAEEMYL